MNVELGTVVRRMVTYFLTITGLARFAEDYRERTRLNRGTIEYAEMVIGRRNEIMRRIDNERDCRHI